MTGTLQMSEVNLILQAVQSNISSGMFRRLLIGTVAMLKIHVQIEGGQYFGSKMLEITDMPFCVVAHVSSHPAAVTWSCATCLIDADGTIC